MAGRLSAVGDRDVRVTVALIVFLNVAARLEDLLVAQGATGFHFGFLGQLLIGENRIALEADTPEAGPRGHFCDQLHARAIRLGEETHIIYQTGFIERLDVVVQALCPIGRAGFRRHQVAQTGFIHRLRAAETDAHFRDVFPLEILRVQAASKR